MLTNDRQISQILTKEFDLAVDLAMSPESSEKPSELAHLQIRHLGPLLALGRSISHRLRSGTRETVFPFQTRTSIALERAMNDGQISIFSTNEGAVGVAGFSSLNTPESYDDRLVDFVERSVAASEQAGVPRRLAQASAGALEEMANNAITHSLQPETAIAGFRVQRRKFEFAVADGGIGILQSLRQSPAFSTLADESDALELAIEDGISRHGAFSGHGMGFRSIFNMPNNHRGYMWLHSGSSALVVGDGLLAATESYIRQVNQVPGVLVSVTFNI